MGCAAQSDGLQDEIGAPASFIEGYRIPASEAFENGSVRLVHGTSKYFAAYVVMDAERHVPIPSEEIPTDEVARTRFYDDRAALTWFADSRERASVYAAGQTTDCFRISSLTGRVGYFKTVKVPIQTFFQLRFYYEARQQIVRFDSTGKKVTSVVNLTSADLLNRIQTHPAFTRFDVMVSIEDPEAVDLGFAPQMLDALNEWQDY